MKLTDEEYEELKKDRIIKTAIHVLRRIMSLNPNERLELRKMDRQGQLRYFESFEERALDVLVDPIIKRHFNIEIDQIERLLEKIEKLKKNTGRRSGEHQERDDWLYVIIVRLYDLGYTMQARRIEFIYRIFVEHNFDNYARLNEASALRRIKEVDAKLMKRFKRK